MAALCVRVFLVNMASAMSRAAGAPVLPPNISPLAAAEAEQEEPTDAAGRGQPAREPEDVAIANAVAADAPSGGLGPSTIGARLMRYAYAPTEGRRPGHAD